MSGTAGAAPPAAVLGLGLDIGGPWHQRAVRKSGALAQTHLLTSSAGGGGRRGPQAPLRLPSLVGPRRSSGTARLSLSEPSLRSPNENVQFEGFSCGRGPSVLQKRPPSPPPLYKSSALLPSKTCHPSASRQPHQRQNQRQVQGCSRPTYIHFSRAIQPSSRPRPVRRHSHNSTLGADTGDLRPFAMQYCNSSSQGEPLSVIGKPCLPSCSQRPAQAATAGPARTQLHVFLPTEAEADEADSESVDEGFMDELDSRITSMKLQQGAPKTVTYH
ncbi:uncharacterized protein LOC120786461 [Xiphias gladius]|uniref:uncharacterized protein LOC120786461 n=1 Tax=Xiphias gladius TaxID=8245 RepID=UPI001A9806E9|nr:uncharacterized protein LOC120786461 [Xiphias gladius]